MAEPSTLPPKLEVTNHAVTRNCGVAGVSTERSGAQRGGAFRRVLRTRGQRAYWVFVLAIASVGFALRTPALRGTLLADDWDHYAMHQRIYPVQTPAWDMFRFVSDAASERDALRDAGRLPWWSSSDLHLAVFRPLSSLLVYTDFSWLGGQDRPWAMHLHSLVWWLVLLGAVAALYKRFLSLPQAVLAFLIFAVDDAHVYPVVWLANRSEVVAVALVCWGIWAHLSADSAALPWRLRAAGWLMIGLGLLAGEHAIAPLSYLVALELCRAHVRLADRWRRLLPYILMTAGYVLCRSALGYGVSGSAFYVDPVGEPLRYFHTAMTRIPLLVGDLWLGMAAEWWYWGIPYAAWFEDIPPAEWTAFPLLQTIQVGVGLTAVLASCAGLWWGYRASRCSQRLRTYWSCLLGAAMSLLPLAGTASMTRLTVVPAIAVNAVIAHWLWRLFTMFVHRNDRLQRVVLATGLALVFGAHVVRPAYWSEEGAVHLSNSSHLEFGWTTQADFGDADVTKRHVFIVSAHDMAAQYLMPYLLHAARLPTPRTAHLLSPAAANSHVLTRSDTNVLDIQFPEPVKNAPFAPMVYRQGGSAFFPGQTFHNALFDVEVKSVRGVEPRHLRFTFKKPLDDLSYLFMYPTEDGIVELPLPGIGRSIRLDSPALPQ